MMQPFFSIVHHEITPAESHDAAGRLGTDIPRMQWEAHPFGEIKGKALLPHTLKGPASSGIFVPPYGGLKIKPNL
jgi:hypothetical protein